MGRFSDKVKIKQKSLDEQADSIRCKYCHDEFANDPNARIVTVQNSGEPIHSDCAQNMGEPTENLRITYDQLLKYQHYKDALMELCEGKPELQAKLCKDFGMSQNLEAKVAETPTTDAQSSTASNARPNLALDVPILYAIKSVVQYSALYSIFLPNTLMDKAKRAGLIEHREICASLGYALPVIILGVYDGQEMVIGIPGKIVASVVMGAIFGMFGAVIGAMIGSVYDQIRDPD